MGFDLWSTLGVSPQVGIPIAVAALGLAVLAALGLVVRRSKSDQTSGIHLGKND